MSRAFIRKKDKSWMHTPEALAKHFIAYNAKFLGSTEVDQPKGTEVVRDAVRKLKFQRHIKKSEGQKIPKVELQISIYGVKILDPKSKDVQHNCQLHRISFCADDKTDKRIFTFICKDSESNKHLCYVFDSEKCAEEITLTIGQAFDLAYKKFLESGGKDVETRKQIGSLQKRIQELETENSELKKQLRVLEEQLLTAQVSPLLHINSTNEAYMLQRPSSLFWCHNLTSFSCLEISSVTLTPMSSPDSTMSTGVLTPPPTKPALSKPPVGDGTPRLRGGRSSKAPTDIFDMVPFSPVAPLVPVPASSASPPPPPARPADIRKDLFGAEPFDPFICGAADFPPDIQSRLDEMQEGFKMGLTVEGAVFSLDPLDGHC
ncbi:PTB domain-containing engulfment adapter protein 1 isoform X1 [Electrophorus electricus]|uniref:PTB domain-containing engulfment adapter protein 1 isoform X1 n=1 Tax=Electrophorus electricus TaxID=8005 RepID=UPI000F0A7692|nr:PTB domain-containing engulfment adapter protein 1 isoform X1 [Electrophorus electricus]XP_026877717.1 PTB domain-containing engulfment adapter protein 1 isoform X1 [Electrophorus electricus]XP_026877726.1 PTB domain-containing engulfment adapter protein 1 isoform X1 [Electrophorus electricus]XP_026877732.1 PTB domain-containing engulfment adapter protein 1 isoform X1 [Electrophorus electricus]XP_026877740.1 PTB domain-containing engulfment adapter protein 1 isoform X1 [Electrophorus electri